jgi:hypothetical protein
MKLAVLSVIVLIALVELAMAIAQRGLSSGQILSLWWCRRGIS